MKLSLKKSLLVIAGAGGVGGVIYYFLPKNSASIENMQEAPALESINTRDNSNFGNVNWGSKLVIFEKKVPKSNGLKAAYAWSKFSPDLGINWMKLTCEDEIKTMSDEEWKEFCT